MQLRQLPNALTCLRVALVLPLGWSIQRGEAVLALGIAALAGLSDVLDGFLARRYGWQSRFGSLLDPLADKLLLAVCYGALWWVHAIPGWLAVLVWGRDAVIVLGAIAYRYWIGPVRGEPTWLGKLSTGLQIGYALLVLIALAGWQGTTLARELGALCVAVATLGSGLDYVLRWSLRAARATRR